ncbi:hypothetical protein QFC20_003007 [Naganishia adeliensis]|uniref:Uncharacterized protein n=1 Tax=Naganishia adeliensis TaxID=92952 RepID=A0ACC2WEI5_9TREE|nr:hypothetical protein QFC20_003007 [Naganishia adeliensis]
MFARAIKPIRPLLLASVVGVAAYQVAGERRRVWNSTGNWDSERKQYNEDLKTNRHKIAAQTGGTPDTPLHNHSTSSTSVHVDTNKSESRTAAPASPPTDSAAHLIEEKAEEADQQTAYNEETGKINWDCPCLGGMAHGPCGEDFKAAFSCFVHSKEEPKGVDCIEKFRLMQACFKEHPDVYGEEIADDDESIQPPAPESGPLSTTKVVEQAAHDRPDSRPVPKAPNAEPPQNNPVDRHYA